MVRRPNNRSIDRHGSTMVFVGDERAVEVRTLIRAMKRDNARGAKGGRKVDVE